MMHTPLHTFHIPVMGLSFTIDSPVRIAQYGISSVVSIMEDELIESMRAFYSKKFGFPFEPIQRFEADHRARRITEYLNLMGRIVNKQFSDLKQSAFEKGSAICRYFELLPGTSPLRQKYLSMMSMHDGDSKRSLQEELRNEMKAGSIDVNIMAKADRPGYTKDDRELPAEYSNALSSLRGYANSDLASSLILSAGYNPRLYAYLCNFKDFFPDETGTIRKKIVLKVSDYRSAQIQGALLAKKGIWVSEFRVESGLNCGGHAFPTEGLLMGPILDEFREKRAILKENMQGYCSAAWKQAGIPSGNFNFNIVFSAQGGIGNYEEDRLLREYYQLDYTGWGSPFLLVPECTNVDEETLHKLAGARPDDYYLSYSSPLGVPINNFRNSSANAERLKRIASGKPGAPCYKQHLASDTEFTQISICTASRKYQEFKTKAIAGSALTEEEKASRISSIYEKECLCEGLSTSALLINKLPLSHKLKAVSICPGPNLAYFNRIATLEEMTDHIYGRTNLIARERPHMFINELRLYMDFYEKQMAQEAKSNQQVKYLAAFRKNLLLGIQYYQNLFSACSDFFSGSISQTEKQLGVFRKKLMEEEELLPA